MGWREVMDTVLAWQPLSHDELMPRLLAMPTPDRIALARELLAGTGRVVARDVGQRISYRRPREPLNYQDGWNACRAAMLAPDDAGG